MLERIIDSLNRQEGGIVIYLNDNNVKDINPIHTVRCISYNALEPVDLEDIFEENENLKSFTIVKTPDEDYYVFETTKLTYRQWKHKIDKTSYTKRNCKISRIMNKVILVEDMVDVTNDVLYNTVLGKYIKNGIVALVYTGAKTLALKLANKMVSFEKSKEKLAVEQYLLSIAEENEVEVKDETPADTKIEDVKKEEKESLI